MLAILMGRDSSGERCMAVVPSTKDGTLSGHALPCVVRQKVMCWLLRLRASFLGLWASLGVVQNVYNSAVAISQSANAFGYRIGLHSLTLFASLCVRA